MTQLSLIEHIECSHVGLSFPLEGFQQGDFSKIFEIGFPIWLRSDIEQGFHPKEQNCLDQDDRAEISKYEQSSQGEK